MQTAFDPAKNYQQFMDLMVAQIRYQDPLDPVDQESITAQLAQISTVEGVNNLNLQFSEMLNAETLFDGAQLTGKRVEYQLAGMDQPAIGTVEAVSARNGKLYLAVDEQELGLTDIQAVLPSLSDMPQTDQVSANSAVSDTASSSSGATESLLSGLLPSALFPSASHLPDLPSTDVPQAN